MTSYSGSLVNGPLSAASSNLGQHFNVARAGWVAGAFLMSAGIGGAKTDTQPVSENPVSRAGSLSRGFERDYYNRLHFSLLGADLGNVISDQIQTLTIWNAYFIPQGISEISESGTDGIELTQERSAPTSFRPLEILTYTFRITSDGPARINASYLFDFDDVDDVTITFTGSRITAWLWGPDGELLERLEWLTNVIEAYKGDEQTIRLREFPRRGFEYAVTLEGTQRRKAEAALYGWGGRAWALPVWMDGEILASDLNAGATSVPSETTSRDYHADGLAVLMSDPGTFEIVQIESLDADSLTLAEPTQMDWTAGQAKLYPIRIARMADTTSLSRFTGDVSGGRVQFSCVDDSDYAAATETTYRGYPVQDMAPNWTEDVASDYMRKVALLDPVVGKRFYDLQDDAPAYGQSHRWLLDGRTQIDAFRKLLYARKGKLTHYWLPTWGQDLIVQTDIGAAALTMDIEHTSYTLQIKQGIGRRDIRIVLRNGTVFYRRITDSVVVDPDTERLSFDTVLGQLVHASDIAVVSYMALTRFDSDAVEINWARWDVAESALNTRSVRNDL